jgi:hypothetical protein
LAEHHVPDHEVVLHEVGGAQDRGVKAGPLDHPLHRELAREMRHVGVEVGVDDGEIDDPLDPRLPREVQRDEGLGEFVGHHGVQQEEGRGVRERGAEGADVEQVAPNRLHARGEVRLRGVADEGAHCGAAGEELLDDVAADGAGGAGDEDGHGACS